MDPHESWQNIQKALKNAEHAIEGANILGRIAADSIAGLYRIYQQMVEMSETVNRQHRHHSPDPEPSRQADPQAHLKEANERIIEKQKQIIAAAEKQLKSSSANATQQSKIAEEEAFRAQERFVHLQHRLDVAQARIFGLAKQLRSSKSEVIERSKHEAAIESSRKTLENMLHSKDSQITAKDLEISRLKSQLRAGEESSKPESPGE